MARLADLVRRETGVLPDNIMLLRHSTKNIEKLLAHGGTVEEYTHTQPTGSKYDFLASGRPHAHVVVVIVRDIVYGVYRVLGVEAEGTRYSLASSAHRQFDIDREKPDAPARRFRVARVPSSADGAAVTGWEGMEIVSVLRSHTATFEEIQVEVPEPARLTEEVPEGPTYSEGSVQQVTVNRYERDPRARDACIAHHGTACAVCGFSFAVVYGPAAAGITHVHHLKPLSEVGEGYRVDPVNDLRPVCPNCHAVIHQGGGCKDIDKVKLMLSQMGRA